MFNVLNIELEQLKLHLLPHGVTLCFACADEGDDPQTVAEYGWVWYLYILMLEPLTLADSRGGKLTPQTSGLAAWTASLG